MTELRAEQASAGMVVILTRDLMARIPLSDLLRRLGYESRFVAEATEFVTALTEGGERVALGVIDMNAPIDWDAIAAFAARPGRAPLLGFGPHVDVAGRRAAKAAGIDRIVANGEFRRDAASLIPRYARAAKAAGT